MGTNYFIRKDICPTCNRSKEKVHIGKKSSGWRFLFRTSIEHFTPEKMLEYVELNKHSIYAEYNRKISYDEFMKIIKPKESDTRHSSPYMNSVQYDYTSLEFS